MKQVIENDFSPILMGLFHNIKEKGIETVAEIDTKLDDEINLKKKDRD